MKLGEFEIDRQKEKWQRLQKVCGVKERHQAAIVVSAEIKDFQIREGLSAPSPDDDSLLAKIDLLTEDGYAPLGRLLNQEAATESLEFFTNLACFNGHVVAQGDGVRRALGGDAEAFPYGSYPIDDIVQAPNLLELANDPAILNAAESYLGCIPTLYSMNVWWSFPQTSGPAWNTQHFHHDADDFRFFSLFIYLTDVTENRGPHQYVRGSHRDDQLETMIARTLGIGVAAEKTESKDNLERVIKSLNSDKCFLDNERAEKIFGKNIDTIYGKAGEGLFCNPAGFHRGQHPVTGARLMAWCRYGLYPNLATFWDGIEAIDGADLCDRLPDTRRSRYINRLIIDY